MKRLFYVLAATAALALAAPTVASAEKIVIKRHDHDGWHHRDHDHGWHHHDRGWHREGRHHHHDGGKTVIIKHSHHDY